MMKHPPSYAPVPTLATTTDTATTTEDDDDDDNDTRFLARGKQEMDLLFSSTRRTCHFCGISSFSPFLLVVLVAAAIAVLSYLSMAEHQGTATSSSSPLSSSVCAPISVPVHDQTWGTQHWQLLFARDEIPGVATQRVNVGEETGFAIQGLVAFDGRLHLAYGDMDYNTGPIEMFAYDPVVATAAGGGAAAAKGLWIYLGTLGTEEVRFLRPAAAQHGGVLYAPETDAHDQVVRDTQGVVYQLQCGAFSWSIAGLPIVPSAHNYDLAILPGTGDLVVSTGSRHGSAAQLAISRDQGQTWTESYRHPTPANKYSRIYFVGTTEDFWFIYGEVCGNGDSRPFALIRYFNDKDDDSFQSIDTINTTAPADATSPNDWPFLVPVIHQNEMIVAAYVGGFPKGRHIASYRVVGREFVPIDPWPKVVEDDSTSSELVAWTPDTVDPKNRLLVLMKSRDNGKAAVFRTNSLAGGVWERALLLDQLLDEDDEYLSLALLLNDLYLGTKQGNLYIVREFYKPADR